MKYLREKKVKFGDGYLDVDIYENDDTYEPPAKRARRKRISPQHIIAANDRHSKNHLRQLIVNNFGAGDYYLTPTYSGKPPGFEEARKQLTNFVNRLKRLYAKYGEELKAVYITEGGRPKDDEGNCTRVHHHIVCNSGTVPREEIERCWKGRQGGEGRGFCNCAVIQPGQDDRGCERIAEYLAKSRTKEQGRGVHRWNGTRNLKRPVETVIDNRFSRKRTEEILSLAKIKQAVKQEENAKLWKVLEYRYDRECIDIITKINPITGRVYISARFTKKTGMTTGG